MRGGHRGGAGAGAPFELATHGHCVIYTNYLTIYTNIVLSIQTLCYLYNKDDVINDQPPPVAAIRNIEIVSRTPLLSCLGPCEH